jgi:hypothetical protein
VKAKWSEDRAVLLGPAGELVARLHVDQWFPRGERQPVPVWIVSWLDPNADSPTMLRARVEMPAQKADSELRRRQLLAGAFEAINRGPRRPDPRSPALPSRPTYVGRFRQAELLIDAWDHANGALGRVLRDDDPYPFERYLALSNVLARLYTVNSTLQGMWEEVPVDIREDASCWADEHAERAIAHNRDVVAKFGKTYDPRNDVALEPYFSRLRSGRPYQHWTGQLLSGALQQGFFDGFKWIRGQMTYRGVIEPIELWQYEPGAEPRWKWMDAGAITTDLKSNANQRCQYERFLAGGDVVGLFSHLLDVFWDAKWRLRKLLRRGELRRGSVRFC